MECIAVLACSAALIFARLALMQELNPVLWGVLAIIVYAGAPSYMIWRGAGWMDAPWVWLSSFGGLFVLFVAQSIAAAIKRERGRAPVVVKGKKKKKGARTPRRPGES
jgi:hypothetical protein